MTTAKLTGDKLKQKSLYHLFAELLAIQRQTDLIIANHTTDKTLIEQLKRQYKGATTIAGKAYQKSIERQTL